jgi:hypothetical protein
MEQSRIFLTSPEEVREQAMIDILEMHADQKVETYALDRSQLPQHLCRPFVLFDEVLLLSYPQAPTESGGDVHFTDDSVRIDEALENWQSLIGLSRRPHSDVVLWTSET